MNRTLQLTVPGRIESLNHFLHKHWSAYSQYKRKWDRSIWAHAQVQLGSAVAELQRLRQAGGIEILSIGLTRRRTGRQKEMDQDNLKGGFKPVLDSLVRLGLLPGDAPGQIPDPEYRDVKGTNEHPEIIVRIDYTNQLER